MQFKRIYILIFAISVVGLAIIQYQYLRIGLSLAKVQFNEKIGLATNQIQEELAISTELTFLVGKAITKDDSYFKLSLDSVQDASRYFLNDFLKEKLLEEGIKTEFTYVLYAKDSTDYLQSPKSFSSGDDLLKYPITLEGYLPELLQKRLILEIQFKNLNSYFLSQLNGLTIPSLIFLAAILLVVLWVLKSFYWQKSVITTTNEFINNLTHELKTPVFSIGLATKILEEKSDSSIKDLVSVIRAQVDKLKVQIDKVLELSTIENRKNVLKKEVIDFKPVIERIVNEFKQLALMEKFEFKSSVSGTKYILLAETIHLENAINSVLDNAKKYTKQKASIEFSSHIKNDMLQIRIKDHGTGISQEDQKKIFKKYYRVSSGDIHQVKGHGLGLHYLKRIISLHNGKIDVKSKPGEGSEFIINLPLYSNGAT